jgi:hypothetical protein
LLGPIFDLIADGAAVDALCMDLNKRRPPGAALLAPVFGLASADVAAGGVRIVARDARGAVVWEGDATATPHLPDQNEAEAIQ